MSLQHEVFSNPRLLQIPTKRAAWSDRTALLMAEMSKLAYYEFEKSSDGNVMPQPDLDGVLERILTPDVTADTPADGVEADQPPALPDGAVRLKEDLARAGFELAGLFSDEGTDTQAFLAISRAGADIRPFGDEDVAVLNFRGDQDHQGLDQQRRSLPEESEGGSGSLGVPGGLRCREAGDPDQSRPSDRRGANAVPYWAQPGWGVGPDRDS